MSDIAVLFDMDGVLVDTTAHHVNSFPRVATSYGYTKEEAQQAVADSRALKSLYANLNAVRPMRDSFPQFVTKTLEVLFQTIEEAGGLKADPALLIFLKDIRSHGVGVAIGTSAVRLSAARKLALAELHHEFDIIVTADDVTEHKPAPDVYLKAAEKLGLPPSHCVVIDDSAHGIAAGRSAGAKTIGFTQYLSDKHALDMADLVADSFGELNYAKLCQLLKR